MADIDLDNKGALVSTFYLGKALYGIDTLDVQEVVPLGRMTTVHHAADYVSGIINLRGQIVTVIDLAKKIEMQAGEDGPRHIMIVTWRGERVGLLVEEVADVVPADLDDLAPPPANVSASQQKFFRGVCQAGTRMATVLDLDVVMGMEEHEITSPGGG